MPRYYTLSKFRHFIQFISFGEMASFVSALDKVHRYAFTSSSATELFSSLKVIVGLSVASLTNLLLVQLEGFDRWPFLDSFWVVCCIFHLIIDNSTNSVHRNWRNPVCVPSPGYSCVGICIAKKTPTKLKCRVCLIDLFPFLYFITAYRSSSLTALCI